MVPDPDLRDRIVAASRTLADGRGWTWLEPIEVLADVARGEPVWEVRTNVLELGRNVRVVLRRSDLAVVEAGYLPR